MIHDYMQLAPVVFGRGASSSLPEKAKGFGARKVLLVYGKSVKAAGIADELTEALEKAGILHVAFEGVVADPPDYLMDEAAAFAREENVDCIVGIGGGSAMDTAKAISILLDNPVSMKRLLNFEGVPPELSCGVPTILVPTTAGTGSEVTRMCVVTRTETNTKVPILTRAQLAIVDPELCRTAPPSVTADGGFDALAHAMESITCVNANPYSETLALAAIEHISRYLPRACNDGDDMEARENLSLAANFAGIAFNLTDVQIGHALADSIAAAYRTPHGRNCAWVNAPVQRLMAEVVPERVKRIGCALGVSFTENESRGSIGRKTAESLRVLMKTCGVESMEDAGLQRSAVLAGASYAVQSPLVFNCPINITEQVAEGLLAEAYDAYKQ